MLCVSGRRSVSAVPTPCNIPMKIIKNNLCDRCNEPISNPDHVCLVLAEPETQTINDRRYRYKPATIFRGPIPYYERVCRDCANSQYDGYTANETPPTTKQGEVCRRCGRWILGPEDMVLHHLSYENDHAVPMHRSCHSALHQEINITQKDGLLKPRDARPKGKERYCACGEEITVPRRKSCTKCWRDSKFLRRNRKGWEKTRST